MTRGWAWTALAFLAFIPLGAAMTALFVVVNEADYDPEIDGEEEAWILFFAVFGFFLAAAACVVAAIISALIGTARARRHPEVAQAPVIATLVWLALGVVGILALVLIVGAGFV